MKKSKHNFLEESGFDVDLFKSENEYSYKNILLAMENYANYRINILNGDILESGEKSFCKCGILTSQITPINGKCSICGKPFK